MIDKREEFLKVLFDRDDNVAWGKDDQDACRPEYPYPMFLHTEAVKFCINPLSTWRDGKHTTAINSLLFEMDKDPDENIIPIKKQVRLFENSKLPYTTMVYSGGKSIHVIVRLTEPLDEKMFRPTWLAISKALTNAGCFIDPATMKIPQLSRVPNSIREDGTLFNDDYEVVGKGPVKQQLIFIKERVSLLELTRWLNENDVTIKVPVPREKSLYIPNANDRVEDKDKFKHAYNMYKSRYGNYDSSVTTGNWNNSFNIGILCYKVDLNLSAAIGLCNTKLGYTFKSKGKDIQTEDAITKGYEWADRNNADKIKLNTKEEYKALLQERGKINRLKLTENIKNYK